MSIKNRLDKIAAALAQSEWQYIVKIADRQGVEPIGWHHAGGTNYGLDDDLSHLKGVVILFAIYTSSSLRNI